MLRIPVDGTRLRILTWLSAPAAAERGLTADDIATRLGVTRPAALTHLRLLTVLGLLRTCADHRYYRRDEVRIAEVAHMFDKGW
ncbi:helix-turn-helix domain-containing protein [Streptomyces sp. NPDC004976]